MKKQRVEMRWQVADGYAGNRRPQKTMIDVEDIEACESVEEVRELVSSCIQDDFEAKISPDWEPSEEDHVIEKWKSIRDEKEADKAKPTGFLLVRFELIDYRWKAIIVGGANEGAWLAIGRADDCKGQCGMDLATSLFHAEEVRSVEVVNGITYAKINTYD